MSYINRLPPEIAEMLMDKGREFLPDEEFNGELKKLTEYWRDTFTKEGIKDQIPYVFAFDWKHDKPERGQTVVALAVEEFNDQNEKRKILLGVGGKLAEDNFSPAMAFLMSEAWMKSNIPQGTQPSDYPDKEEVLVFIGQTIDGRMNSSHMHISKDATGKRVLSEPTIIPSGGEQGFGGDLLDYLFAGYALVSKGKEKEKK